MAKQVGGDVEKLPFGQRPVLILGHLDLAAKLEHFKHPILVETSEILPAVVITLVLLPQEVSFKVLQDLLAEITVLY